MTQANTNTVASPTVEVCFGPECSDRGGHALAQQLESIGIQTTIGDCRSQCPNACLVLVNNKMVVHGTIERVQAKIKELQTAHET